MGKKYSGTCKRWGTISLGIANTPLKYNWTVFYLENEGGAWRKEGKGNEGTKIEGRLWGVGVGK